MGDVGFGKHRAVRRQSQTKWFPFVFVAMDMGNDED